MKLDDSLRYILVPADEISQRISRLQQRVTQQELDGVLILDSVNMYYYTGTMQQGLVVVPAQGEPVFLVRRSLERATFESPLQRILPLQGLSRLHSVFDELGLSSSNIGIAEATLTVSTYKALVKALPQTRFTDIGTTLSLVRSVKSAYEVGCLRKAGAFHQQVYEAIPAMIDEGMSEWELGAEIQKTMMALEYTGITRFSVSGMELFMGVISSGESGNYPTASIGPGGGLGLSPAFPFVGGRKKIGRSEPIFIDTGFGYAGYFTDKTRIFSIGELPKVALEAHERCLEIQEAVRYRLKPGAIPSQIYEEVYESLVRGRGFEQHFMGYGGNHVPFFGHGIGLAIDEFPVIAAKVHTPLEANMVIALEPKKGLENIGLVGIENTFLVTEKGGEKLTPGGDGVVAV
ncbi:MAG: Xaa-Pro peptidase family protein [Desulfobulbus sp.]|nr:Xaa-Pro peptidase family protein [Desulfobulbus sp.]